jgi:hypothetical protein
LDRILHWRKDRPACAGAENTSAANSLSPPSRLPWGEPWEGTDKIKKWQSIQCTGAQQEAARVVGLQIHVLNASTSNEIDAAFAALARNRPDALIVANNGFFSSELPPWRRATGFRLLLGVVSMSQSAD